jgi:hypothetical protein
MSMPQAICENNSICVTESCNGSNTKVTNATTASGNIFTGINLNGDTSTMVSNITSNYGKAVITANSITISGEYGTLVVYTTTANGHTAGDYTYTLNAGAVPPAGTDSDQFTYTLTDCTGCSSSSTLTICLNVTQITMPQAVCESNSICVSESVCGKTTKVSSSTSATGNILSTISGLAADPSSIIKISDSKNPNGVTATNGQIVISGLYGTLTVYTSGANAGSYTYTLNSGVVPTNGESDSFTYTIEDKSGCESSANLVIALNVTQTQMPPQNGNGCGQNPPSCGDHGKGNNCGNNQDHHKHQGCGDNHQQICGNVHDHCGDNNGNSQHCKIVSYSCNDQNNNPVACKPGQPVHTCNGQFTLHENGNYCFIPKDACKSFHENINYTSCDAKGQHEHCSFGIHTSDVAPCHDYIVHADDIAPKFTISMQDLGLHQPEFGCLGSKSAQCSTPENNGHCQQQAPACHAPALPPTCSEAHAIDHHILACQLELHHHK